MAHSSIEVNESTARFFTIITGMPWPEIREGDLRDVRDAYEQLHKELPELRALIAKVAIACARQFKGQAATTFTYQMNAFIGANGGDDYVTAAAKTAKALADCAGDVANTVEYTKWMAIAQLVQLIVEIALAIFWAPFSFGTSLSGLVLKKLLTKVALTALMKYLLKTIAMHTFSGIVGGLLMDGVIQNLQIGQGNRKEIDKEYTKQAVLFGVIGGVLGGPLDLLGLGLGKLLGRLLGKSGGRLLADKLSDYLVNGELKSLKGTLKTAAEAAAKSGEKGTLGTIGKETSKGLADEALKKAQAKAFARDLGSLMEASAEQLQAGFGKTGKGTLGGIFVKEMEKTFVKHLGEQLGKKGAGALGRELGEAFAEKWVGKSQQSVLSRGAASEGLKEALGAVLTQEGNAGKGLTAHQINALGKHLPDLADGLTQGNKMFQLGLALGNYVQSGTQNVLSEGFYNLIFGENHEFTVTAGSFVGGMMTAMMGHVLHLGTAPLMHGYADLVQRTQFQAVKDGASKYFPLYHPISFAALASMASGKLVPFPVPRMGHPEAFEFARSFRVDSLEDVAKGLSHASGVDIKTPPADREVAEWMQQLLPYVDFLAEERGGGDHLSLAETLTRTIGGSTETLVPTDGSTGTPKAGGSKDGEGNAPGAPVKVQSDDAPAVAPKPRSQESEQKAPDRRSSERAPSETAGQETPRRNAPARKGAAPPVSTESAGDGPAAPRRRVGGADDSAATTEHATASATVATSSAGHPAPDRTPDRAPNPPVGTDASGRHDVQEPAPRIPRQTGSIASVLGGQDTPLGRTPDDTTTRPRTSTDEDKALPPPAPDEEVPLPNAPYGGDADTEASARPPAADPATAPAADPATAPAAPTAPTAGTVPPPTRHNAWQPTEPDGTLKGGPRRPPALQAGERQETLPNGTVRVFQARLDPSVGEGAPLAAFPSRWSRSLLDPGTVYYPKSWTEAHLAARVDEALGNAQLVRVENGVTFKLGRADDVWIEGMYLADGSFLGHRPSPHQSLRDPRYDVGGAPTVGRGAEAPLTGFGPVSVRRELLSDGTELVRLTARVRLVGTENVPQPDLVRAQIGLHRAAGRLLAGPDGTTRMELGLRFTRDGDATEIPFVPGQDLTLQQAVPLLHEAATGPGPAGLLAAVREQAPPPPHTVSGETMLLGAQALFAPAVWDRPTEGRHLPREWTADEARYAASVVARSAFRAPAGPVPPGGTTAPTLRHGEFAGVKLTVRVEDGRITDFWARPDQRVPDQSATPAPERRRVLGTREVAPPADAFDRALEERRLQRFSVSRVRLADGDTESVVTVKVYLDTGDLDLTKRAAKDGLKDLTRNARARMAEIYDLGQRLPGGDRLRVKLAFVRGPGEAHHTVQVHPTQPRPNALNWGLDTPAKAVVHEVGHLLGLPDEYREPSRPGRVRPVHGDGGMMGATTRDRFDRVGVDADNPHGNGSREDPRPVLKARNLRQLGAVIDTAFGAERGPGPEGTHPPRPRVNEDARRAALYGDRRDGGHLLPPPGSDRPRPERVAGSENRNGTFRVLGGPADPVTTGHHRSAGDLALGPAGALREGDRHRTMFPEHWSEDDAVYAAEQAYQHARRQETPAFTELRPGSWSFTGEYGGVRIEGRVEVRTEFRPENPAENRPGGPVEVAEIVSFRPADDQGGLGAAPHLPWHPFPDTFGQRVVDLVRYGDRQTLTGFHHQPDLGRPREGDFSPVERAGHRMGVRMGNRSFHSNPNGTYRATAWFLDPFVAPRAHLAQFPSRWFRRADHPTNMFYPSHWRAGRVLDAVGTAYENRNRAEDRVVNGAVHWTGTGDGVRIEGITRDGRHLIHRPADDQPDARRRGNSAPLTEPGLPGTGRRPAVLADLSTIAVPPNEVGVLRTGAGRGLPQEWTAGEALYAAYAGRPLVNETALDDGGSRGQVRFAGVEITVVRDGNRRIVDFMVADGHVPPLQHAVPIPERGSRQPARQTGGTEPLPHFPASDEGSEHDTGSPDGHRRLDEDEAMELYPESDEETSFTDSTLDLLSSDDEDMDWEGGSGAGSGRRSEDADARSDLLMDLDEAPERPQPVRPAYEAPAPDLRFAVVLDPVEISAPADPALHSSTSTHHRRFQASRGYLLDGTPAVEAVVRIHLDTSQLPAGQDHTEALGDLRERARRSVDEYLNTGHRLPDGDVLVVRAEFVDDPGAAHHRVLVLDGDVREHNDLWGLHSDGSVLGHEIGHLFGLPDEYRERRLFEEAVDEDGDVVVVSHEVRPRPVYTDAGLMAGTLAAHDRARVDMNAGVTPDGTPMRFALTPRNLRELGAVIEQALGPVQPVPNARELPRRAAFDLDSRQSSLFGDTRNPGGHLLPPTGSDRTAPERVVRVERNGVVVADFSPSSAVPRARQVATLSAAGDLLTTGPAHRRMFPRNWTGEDAVYAAEQAYLNALGTDTVVPLGGSRYRWTGEYAGVRIEGEVRGDRFLSFRPADDQPDVDPPLNAPHRPTPDDPDRGTGAFGQRAEDVVRYGDRQHLTGLHHELNPDHVADPANTLRAHGVRVVETTPAIHNGTYRARVAFLDPTVAPNSPLAEFPTRWRFRGNADGGSGRTMYPREWRSEELLSRVDEAHDGVPADRRVYLEDGRTYYWVGEADGVRIEGLSRDGAHLAHRPTDTQPMTGWDQKRVLSTSAPTRTWMGDRPLAVSRVLFDSGQEGLRITVPVRTVVEGRVTPELRAFAEEAVQQRVNAYVQERVRETADANGVPPRLVAVVLDFTPGRADVFSEVVVRPDAVSDVPAVLGPLAVQGQDQVFNAVGAALSDFTTPLADLVAQQGAPRVPADLREPGPLRPGEHPPAVLAGWDQQTARQLRDLEARFSLAAAAADPRLLPVGHSLPREWTARDARWAAVQVLNEHDSRFGSTVTDVVRGSFGGVELAVHVEDGQIVLVTGVGDQRDLAQLHVPPFTLDGGEQPAPALAADVRREGGQEDSRQPSTPADNEPAGAPMLRALVEDDPRLLRELFGEAEGGRVSADPATAERALRELVEERLRQNPELGREAYELYAAWARRLGDEVAHWPAFVADLHREIAAWGEHGRDAVRDPRAVRDAFAVLTAAALDLRVTLVDVGNDRATVSEFGPANGRRVTLDHTEQDGYSTVAAAEHRQEQRRLDRLRRERAEEEAERQEAEERERLRREAEEDLSEEELTAEERQRIQRNAAGKRRAEGPVDDGEDVRESPVRESPVRESTVRENPVRDKRGSDQDLPEILRRIEEMENAESGKQGQSSGSRLPLTRSEDENAGPVTPPKDEPELPAPPKDEAVVVPAPPKADEREPLLAPRTVTESGMLSGSHMVTGIGEPNSALVTNLADRIVGVLPPETVNRQALAHTLAESLFSDSGLRAQVSALSRGEVLHIPVGTDARQGTVTIRGEVADLVHRAKDKPKAKFEYEGGSDRVVTLGTTTGGRKRLGLGLQGRFDFFKLFRVQGAGGVQGDLMSWEGLTTRARFFSRSKTTELTEMFDGRLHLEVGYQPAGRRGTEDLSHRLDPTAANVVTTPIEVGIPQRETRASAEAPDPAHQGWPDGFDPARRTQARLHLSHVMLDVHAKGLPQLRPTPGEDAGGSVELQDLNTPPGRPVQRQVMAGVVDLLTRHADVRAAFAGNTRTLSDRLVAEFGYQRLQQDFKGMTNGEAVVIRVPGSDVRIEVKAANRELNVLALTKETEFNTGAGSVTTKLRRKVVSGLWQLQGGGRLGPDTVNVGGAYGIRKGSDSIHISGRTLETAVTTKTKEPGAVLDGDGYLEVVVRKGDQQVGDAVEVPVGFRTLMPQADLLTPPRTDPQAGTAPEHGLTSTLLPESTVVRDIGSVGELRADLERAGKEYYGSLWPAVRDEVMQLVTQPALATRLSAMTRGEQFELNSFDQSKLGVLKDSALGRNLKVTVRATLTDSEFLRQSGNADLSRQNESSTFTSERRQSGKHKVKQGGIGFPVAENPPYGNADLGLQERARVGVRDSAADKLYANSKIRDAQNIHRATVRLTVTLEGRGGAREVSGDFGTEFGVRAPKATLEAVTPTVLPRNELGASTVVAFKERDDGRSGGGEVLSEVRGALKKRFAARGGVSRELERVLAEELGAKTLQANLSQLTRGGVLKVPVEGPGWSAEVLVRARLRDAPVLRREVNDAEIEVGTQNRTGHGVSHDQRERVTGTVGLTGRPGTDGKSVLTVDYSYRHDSATGIALETAGSTVNRAKNVSKAAVSDADAVFDVEIRGWTGGLIPTTTKLEPITMKAEVVTPQYGAVEAPRAVPDRIWQTHLLGSSDVVTNVFVPDGARTGATPPDFGKALLRGAGDPGEFGGRNLTKWLDGLGRSGIRHKLYEVLTPNTLHDQLKAMMSGRELVVSDGGATIRIGASVRRLAHTGSTTTTEFNTGTQTEHSHSAADGATGGGTGSGHQLRATVGVTGGAWYAGGALTGATGHDTQETWSNRTGSGNTTKVKPKNASIFTGEADLHFRVEWKEPVGSTPPFVMATRHAYFRRPVGMEAVIDVAETRAQAPAGATPNPGNAFDSATAPRGAALRALADHGPEGNAVRIPPDRVWTHGLVDTDVVRSVGMGPDARRQLTAGAEEFLGSGTWDRIRGTVGRMIDPVALASRLSTPLTPLTPAAPAGNAGQAPASGAPTLTHGPGNSTLLIGPTDLAGDVRVEVRVKVKELEFVRTDSESESNPTNTTSVTDGVNAQRTLQVAGRLTGGAKGDLHESVGGRAGGYLDGAYQHRTDLATGEGGQLVGNAKIKTDTARYRGFAEVEVIYHKGELRLPRKELMAIEIDIPVDSTRDHTEVPTGGYLRFDEDTPGGELRLHGAPRTAVTSVADALGLSPDVPEDRPRILGVGHAARELLAGSLTTEGERAARWLRGLDRMLLLGADESNAGAFEQLRRVLDGRPVPAGDRRRLQELAEHVGEDLAMTAADVNARWDAPGVHQPVDLSLRVPSAGADPVIRLEADGHSTSGMNRLLDDVGRRVLRAEGDGPQLVEIVLDVSPERAAKEAARLERRLREVLRTTEREVEVVIVTTTAQVVRAEPAEPGRAAGGVRRFRVGPPSRDAAEDVPVHEPPVHEPPVHEPPVQVPPVENVPVENVPVQVPPVRRAPVEEVPEQQPTTEQGGPPVQERVQEQVQEQVQPTPVRTVEDTPEPEPPHTPEDDSVTSDSSSRSDSSDSSEDLSREREHEREASGDSWVTAPLYEGADEFYLHAGARLGNESDNVSVDSDLPDLPHEREASGASWQTARLYEGEDESDPLDSRSESSEDSWVQVQPPQFYQQGSNPPLPRRQEAGPPRHEEPLPGESLEDSIFSALTQLNGGGEQG
ncbi:EndoU domain-containing protein [Kitasatospora purpeofusca]|uniref:EndoU domain-containing protein n=1 Tax=Kitasatospora purpeofusca TaxID=67352 RepID=UPI0036D2FF40